MFSPFIIVFFLIAFIGLSLTGIIFVSIKESKEKEESNKKIFDDIMLKKAGEEDIQGIMNINYYVQKDHCKAYPDIYKDPKKYTFEIEQFFLNALKGDNSELLIVKHHDVVIGYVLFSKETKEESVFKNKREFIHIKHIGVLPEYQGQGIGSQLIYEVESYAKNMHIKDIQLTSLDFNTEAHEFFKTQGFNFKSISFDKKI